MRPAQPAASAGILSCLLMACLRPYGRPAGARINHLPFVLFLTLGGGAASPAGRHQFLSGGHPRSQPQQLILRAPGSRGSGIRLAGLEGLAPTCGLPQLPAHRGPREAPPARPSEQPQFALSCSSRARPSVGDAPLRPAPFQGRQVPPALHLPSMAVYTCTGYNDYHMYLNQGQQTIPNGLVRTGRGGAGRGSRGAVHPTVPAPAPTCLGHAPSSACGSVWCPVHLPGSRVLTGRQPGPTFLGKRASFGAFLGFVCG